MKKKLILLSAILLMCCPFAYGCNNNSSNTNSDVNMPYANTGTTWDNTINGVYEVALDKALYPYSDNIYINVDENNKLVDYTIIVAEETTSKQAVTYATDLIKSFNDIASKKDDSVSPSSDDYYGSVFDEYEIVMTIATEKSILNEKDWLVCQTIKAGEHTPIVAGGFKGNSNNEDTQQAEEE